MKMRNTWTGSITACVLVLFSGVLGGCQGHGQYTTEHKKQAEQKMAVIRAGTEWEMGRQAFLSGELTKALRRVDNSIALAPEVAKSHLLRGRILLEKGDLPEARESLLKAEALEPENVDAQYYLAITHERLRQPEEALKRYVRASELDPSAPQFAVAGAEMLIDLNRLEEAEKFLTTRNSSFEHYAGVRQTLGHIALLRGDTARAVTMFNEARLLAPDDLMILEDLVRAQMRAGQFAQADTGLAQLLRAKENEGRRDLKHLRGQCLVAIQRPMEAREIYMGLTSGDEGASDVRAWIELGKIAFTINDRPRVRQSFARVVALAPERYEGYLIRGLWQRREGDNRGALKSFEEAVTRRGNATEPLLMLGIMQQELGRVSDARQTFQRVAQEDPSNEIAAAYLVQLDGPSRTATVPEPRD